MSDSHSTSSSTSLFDLIENTLGATARGRAFLSECGRRARSEEATLLLEAVARLERHARERPPSLDRDELRSLIGQIEMALRDTRLALRGSIASDRDTRDENAASAIASVGRETAKTILQTVELIQETAWMMREAGFDAALCDRLDDQAAAIHSAGGRQEHLLDGLSTLERAIGRADACVAELRRFAEPIPSALPLPPMSDDPITLIDSDIEFVRRSASDEPPPGA